MINKEYDIRDAQEVTGWAYTGMKWLTEAEAKEANQKRSKILQSISGRINCNFRGNKLGPGELSPGCMSCGQGTWSCIFIGSLCTAKCFYCPQDSKKKNDQPPTESGLIFDNADDYVDYLEKFKFKGVSFSGGEPFLKFKEVLTYIKKIRERLGNSIYIWLYTNGDLVDKNKLKTLKEAGLDEIRFDIAARKYDLKAAKMAVGIIDRVTVEIPAIPEDYEIVKKCLSRMKKAGIAHLNLHQLHASRYCYQEFVDRGYTFLHKPDMPILESELTALRLIQYAVDKNIGLPINYCSTIYKNRFQRKGYRERFYSFIKKEYESLTEFGFIRRLAIQDTPLQIKVLLKTFEKNKCKASLWSVSKNGYELSLHHSLLRYIDFNKYALTLNYFAPQLIPNGNEADDNCKKIALNSSRDVFIEKKLVYQTKIKNPVTVKSFQKLYIRKMNVRDVYREFFKNFNLRKKADIADMMNERDRLDYWKIWEFIGSGLSEIY